jgi:hypothetical protein
MSRLEEFCGQTDDHEEHEWTDRHDYDFRCLGWRDGHVLWSHDGPDPIDPAVTAALDVWIARSAARMESSAQEHVQAMIDAARPIIEQQVQLIDQEPMVEPFNWQEADRDSFMHWAVVSMISDRRNGIAALNAVMHASDGATKLKIMLDINGVRMSAVPFFERLWQEMQRQADIRATELVEVELTKLTDAHVSVERIMHLATTAIRQQLRERGLPMKEEEDEW